MGWLSFAAPCLSYGLVLVVLAMLMIAIANSTPLQMGHRIDTHAAPRTARTQIEFDRTSTFD
jgi:hypothetical protein